jgi:hypothetical protein
MAATNLKTVCVYSQDATPAFAGPATRRMGMDQASRQALPRSACKNPASKAARDAATQTAATRASYRSGVRSPSPAKRNQESCTVVSALGWWCASAVHKMVMCMHVWMLAYAQHVCGLVNSLSATGGSLGCDKGACDNSCGSNR